MAATIIPTNIPIPNVLPPEILTITFTYVPSNLQHLSGPERVARQIERGKTYRQCAITCKAWKSVALQFVWRDLTVTHLGDCMRPVGGKCLSELHVDHKWDTSVVRRVTELFQHQKDCKRLIEGLKVFSNLRIVKLKGWRMGAYNLATLFQELPKVEALSLRVHNLVSSGEQACWELEPVEKALKEGLGRLRILDMEVECGLAFIKFVFANLPSTLQALTYIAPATGVFAHLLDLYFQSPGQSPPELTFLDCTRLFTPSTLNPIISTICFSASALSKLTSLVIRDEDMTREAAKAVSEGCIHLTSLSLQDVNILTGALAALAKGPKLTTFLLVRDPSTALAHDGGLSALIHDRAAHWVSLYLKDVPLSPDELLMLGERGGDSLRNVRLEEWTSVCFTESIETFVRRCTKLRRFDCGWDSPTFRALLEERGIVGCEADDGREEVDMLEEEIFLQP
ncbi:hypothetical protein HDV00_003698 [Rhizophlyctis rosea]|nr:hypothetical protein HDV00_003698 [Rhizophlyctis rosea]